LRTTFVLAVWLALPLSADATSIKGLAFDCTGVELNHVDQSNLTDAEKLLLMQQALFDSIDRYSACMKNVQGEMAKGSDSGANAAAGEGVDGQMGVGSDGTINTEQTPIEIANDPAAIQKNTIAPPRGAGPKVIPPADNASAICKLLYEEIKNEQDKAVRQRLSEEYNRYGCN